MNLKASCKSSHLPILGFVRMFCWGVPCLWSFWCWWLPSNEKKSRPCREWVEPLEWRNLKEPHKEEAWQEAQINDEAVCEGASKICINLHYLIQKARASWKLERNYFTMIGQKMKLDAMESGHGSRDKNKPTKLVILSHPAVYPGWGLNMLPLGPFSMEAQGGSIYCRNWQKIVHSRHAACLCIAGHSWRRRLWWPGKPPETNLLGYNIHSNDYSESSVANPMAYKSYTSHSVNPINLPLFSDDFWFFANSTTSKHKISPLADEFWPGPATSGRTYLGVTFSRPAVQQAEHPHIQLLLIFALHIDLALKSQKLRLHRSFLAGRTQKELETS